MSSQRNHKHSHVEKSTQLPLFKGEHNSKHTYHKDNQIMVVNQYRGIVKPFFDLFNIIPKVENKFYLTNSVWCMSEIE